MLIEDIWPSSWQGTRGVYTPAKKIDIGNCYLIIVSGQQARKDENNEVFSDDIELQTEDVFMQINDILEEAGASMDNAVKAVLYFTDIEADFMKVSAIRDKWFANSKPISTCLSCNGFSRKGAKIEIEVTAIMEK
ncbi:MAG: RidA family protein [Oscillospiraceae bacterium]|nr:RidA family protein [Oscillospiraceae bacterium]